MPGGNEDTGRESRNRDTGKGGGAAARWRGMGPSREMCKGRRGKVTWRRGRETRIKEGSAWRENIGTEGGERGELKKRVIS